MRPQKDKESILQQFVNPLKDFAHAVQCIISALDYLIKKYTG